jgi:hypothetical protein
MLLEGSRRIAIVTDSSAYMPEGWAEKYNIHIVPLILMMGGKSLRASKDFPTTSQPNVATFEEFFNKISTGVDGILAVIVTSKLSGTFASAKAAATNLKNIPIEVIDSQGTSMMMGYALRAAAMVANAGGDLQAVTQAAREKLDIGIGVGPQADPGIPGWYDQGHCQGADPAQGIGKVVQSDRRAGAGRKNVHVRGQRGRPGRGDTGHGPTPRPVPPRGTIGDRVQPRHRRPRRTRFGGGRFLYRG